MGDRPSPWRCGAGCDVAPPGSDEGIQRVGSSFSEVASRDASLQVAALLGQLARSRAYNSGTVAPGRATGWSLRCPAGSWMHGCYSVRKCFAFCQLILSIYVPEEDICTESV